MANKIINDLTQVSGAFVNRADELPIQQSGDTTVKKALVSDIFGGWRDMRSSLVAAATGAGTPTLTAFGPSGNIKQLAFGVGDSVYLAMHVDHDILVGSTAYMHVHWATNGTSTNSVKWELDYTTAERNDTTHDTFGADTTITLEASPQGSAWEHIVTEDAVGFVIPPVDSLLIVELKRVTNGGSENADTVFGLFVDVHYQCSTYATKNRAPDFYA